MMHPQLKRLTQEDRIAARSRALDAVQAFAGAAPNRAHYRHSSQSEYPAWLRLLIVGLAVVVLVCAFALSAMRLYHVGSATFAASIEDPAAATVAGVAIVLLSEAAAVLFTIAYSVLGKDPAQKRILALSVFGTAALALSGNYYVALHKHVLTVFNVLEAMLPPLLTLSTAYVLKALMLDEIAARHADERLYQSALQEWKAATANPEDHPRYIQMYANELWDALTRANARRESVRAWLTGLDSGQRSALVRLEMNADNWLDDTPTPALPAVLEDDTHPAPAYQEAEDSPFLAGVGRIQTASLSG